MIKMGRYNYAFQNFDATKHVRASIREKKISHKHARETAKAIKGLTLEKARDYMLSVIAKERAASGVPGSVDGLLKAWRDHGSDNISRRELLAPAIALAERGFELTHYEAKRFNNNKDLFLNNNAAAKIFIRGDRKPWKEGDRFIQKDLARTLQRRGKK